MKAFKAGFTLIEILVVLVILGIVASVVVLKIGTQSRKEVEVFVRGLEQSLSLAEEEALLRPATLGLAFKAQSYCFYEYHREQGKVIWKALSDPRLGERSLPQGLTISHPIILISNSGELTPFRLVIRNEKGKALAEISGRVDGSIHSEFRSAT